MAAHGVQCPNCQFVNRAGARFCSQCRAPLDAPPPVMRGTPTGPRTDPASHYEVPPAPVSSEGRSMMAPIIIILLLLAVLATAGIWYLSSHGNSLAGLPIIGGSPSTPVPGVPTLLSAAPTLLASGPPATFLAGVPSTLAAGVPATLVAQVSGIVKTPTTAPAGAQGATPASAYNGTPVPDAEVIVESANLRAGPATVFDILGVLHKGEPLSLISRNLTSDWLHVRTQANGVGWVAASLVKLNTQLAAVPVDNAIPTPPPVPPPAPPVMAGSQGCPPGPAMLSLVNQGGSTLIIVLQGAKKYFLNVGPGQTQNICLAQGPYHFVATTTTTGAMEQGDKVLMGTAPTCWSLPSGGAPLCNPPSDPGAYTPASELPIPVGFN